MPASVDLFFLIMIEPNKREVEMNSLQDRRFADYMSGMYSSDIYVGNDSRLYPSYGNTSLAWMDIQQLAPSLGQLSYSVVERLLDPDLYDQSINYPFLKDFDTKVDASLQEITNSTPIEELSGYKITRVQHLGQDKILEEELASNFSLDTVEELYVTLSKFGLTPQVLFA